MVINIRLLYVRPPISLFDHSTQLFISAQIIERLHEFNSQSAFDEEFDRVLTLGYQILDTDGDAEKFSKTNIWK